MRSYQSTTRLELRHARGIVDAFEALGLRPRALKAVSEKIAHAERCATESTSRPQLLASRTAEIAAEVAYGRVTFDDGIAQAIEQQNLVQMSATVTELLDTAATKANGLALAEIRGAAAALLAALDDEAKRLGETGRTNAYLVEDVRNATEAMRSGAAVAAAWSELTTAATRLTTVQVLADDLRTYRLINTPRDAHPDRLHYARPDKLPEPGQSPREQVHKFIRLCAAEPCENREEIRYDPPTTEAPLRIGEVLEHRNHSLPEGPTNPFAMQH
ncbi:hypothetical protein [Rhodococcus sp. ACPA1]|uniref:hypothetical protein n=1 Tax=Rhodococcus sp. ACPA1 TaxID=2028572 RepID=UPI000BB11957|nr:hypothetical protein [Rhodococcus sp. ACPA1]PBC54895.1 hypothetical protein CJ177_17955 [Rhodococcus sp. ACPA1]